MSQSKLLYVLFLLFYLPAIGILLVGAIFILPATVMDVEKGYLETIVYFLLPLLGGCVGFLSAIALAFDVTGGSTTVRLIRSKRAGLVLGVVCELWALYVFPPNLQTLLVVFLPPLLAAVALFWLSYNVAANKPNNGAPSAPDAASRAGF